MYACGYMKLIFFPTPWQAAASAQIPPYSLQPPQTAFFFLLPLSLQFHIRVHVVTLWTHQPNTGMCPVQIPKAAWQLTPRAAAEAGRMRASSHVRPQVPMSALQQLPACLVRPPHHACCTCSLGLSASKAVKLVIYKKHESQSLISFSGLKCFLELHRLQGLEGSTVY